MEKLRKFAKAIKKLTWFFIIIGFIEICLFLYITSSFYAIIPGLITIVTAYISLAEGKLNWKYFVSIWAFIKYNPLTFFLSMLFLPSFLKNKFDSNLNFVIILFLLTLVSIGISSLITGIFIILKTNKLFKLMKLYLANKNQEQQIA